MSAFCGAVLGIAVLLLVRPLVAGGALIGTQYFDAHRDAHRLGVRRDAGRRAGDRPPSRR